MKYTRENIVEGIHAKLEELYGDDPLYKGMLEIDKQELVNYPIEVEQNVLEWINNLPLTEVDCHGVSIKYVIDSCGVAIDAFPIVLRNFINFKNAKFCDRYICFAFLAGQKY